MSTLVKNIENLKLMRFNQDSSRNWVSCHLPLVDGEVESYYLQLKRLANALLDFDRFFFVRYCDGVYHLRLRLLDPSEEEMAFLEPYIFNESRIFQKKTRFFFFVFHFYFLFLFYY